ncbi:MAG TPA: HD-GYP domain-containing protein [Microthrixaceae bacterium]|nr:HD-GYP domain-containing protein [Microthrixaceae bacterium]HNA37441.1 HD-GYP domain-containing protein [Microthrixaceae bacterium]HNK36998.1 HD-GYP domain-containing protein [Microthrixaceae bacterium]
MSRVDGSAQSLDEHALRCLPMLADHDRSTAIHAGRVTAYAVEIGLELGLDPDELNDLRWAAALHDVGKVAVPPGILNKHGRLNDEELGVARAHPLIGMQMLDPYRRWLGATVDGVAQHHERWDGHGYPFGLAGERISPLARIVTLADSFDAILSCRSYSEPMTSLRARAEIVRCTGSQFDPGVVDALFARMDRALDDPDRLVPVEVVTAGDLMGIDWTKLLLSPSPMTRAHAWT